MQANQLYKHERTGGLYRILLPWVPGKAGDKWEDGVVYVGAYDGKVRWTTAQRWLDSFVKVADRFGED